VSGRGQPGLDLHDPADNALRRPIAEVLRDAPADWAPLVDAWRASDAGRRLLAFVAGRQAAGATIYPAQVLRALALTPRAAVRVVILGQDPYHGAGQAEGLAFSVPLGVRKPPSLRNVDLELQRDLVNVSARSVSLGDWARAGVLLLNTVLTVEEGRPGSHAGRGWEALTDDVIRAAAIDRPGRVFMLWGAAAQAKVALIESVAPGAHLVLQANHPSPLSARRPPSPFIGCGHFGLASAYLAARGQPIDWSH
jgi:uracil-DNA glycosylase